MPHQIVRKGTLLGSVVDKHGDGSPHIFIDVNDENFLIIANKDGSARAGRQHGSHMDFDYGFGHTRLTVSFLPENTRITHCTASKSRTVKFF